jgi:hypothetical protein
MRLKRGVRRSAAVRLVAVAVVALGVLSSSVTAASGGTSGESQETVVGIQGIDESGILSATNCRGAEGPGNVNKHCVRVIGTGTYVESVEGWLSSTILPWFPAQICDVTVYVWGRRYWWGENWSRSYRNTGCNLGTLGAKWYVYAHFQAGSWLCARTVWHGYWPEPACIEIRA